jgi:hypothetical protein
LIVGKCNEEILNVIYRFIKKILETEFTGIQMGLVVQKGHVGGGGGGDAGGLGDGDGDGVGLGKSGVRNIRKKKLYMTNITYYIEPDI